MRKVLLAGLLALVAAALIVTVALAHGGKGEGKRLAAKLDSYQEVPTLSTTGHGKFKAKVRGDTIEYRLSYADLTSPVKFAHIHLGRPAVNGGVIAFLCGGGGKPACPASGEVTGTIVAADVMGLPDQGLAAKDFAAFVRALKAGATYANVHTDNFPSGEIRGQINGGHGHGFDQGFGFGGGGERGKGHEDKGGHDH